MGNVLVLLPLHLLASLQLGFKSHVVHEEVSHFPLQVLHLVLQFTHLGLQLISCTDLTVLRWKDFLLRLYMGADKASLISLNMLRHFMPVDIELRHLMPAELKSHMTTVSKLQISMWSCVTSFHACIKLLTMSKVTDLCRLLASCHLYHKFCLLLEINYTMAERQA